jgi:mono/diheme cytochrome c family protein
MSNASKRPSPIVLISGVITGIGVYVGVCVTSGFAIVPTVESVTTISHGLSEPNRDVAYVQKAPIAAAGAGGAYATVCQSCHQADGKGLPGAFPPLAGSSWVTGDPETPVRIVLLGLSGPIEVNGSQFNAVMPPPVGMSDETIAEAVSHARTSFGNGASKIDAAFVKQVRDSLAGRTNPWTAAELTALRPAAGAAPAPTAPEGAMAPAPAPAPTQGAAPAAPVAPAAPAAPK